MMNLTAAQKPFWDRILKFMNCNSLSYLFKTYQLVLTAWHSLWVVLFPVTHFFCLSSQSCVPLSLRSQMRDRMMKHVKGLSSTTCPAMLACWEPTLVFALWYPKPSIEQAADLSVKCAQLWLYCHVHYAKSLLGLRFFLYWHCPFAWDYRFSECWLAFVYIKTILWSTSQMQILSCDSDKDYVVTTSWHVFCFYAI